MEIDLVRAIDTFLEFQPELQAPTLHPAFLVADSKRNEDLIPVFWLYEEKENQFRFYHAFHLSQISDTDYYDIRSAYGYGGPLANTNDAAFLSRAWKFYTQWCAEKKVVAEFVRFHPLLENWKYYQGAVWPERQTVWIDLLNQDRMNLYDKRVRTSIRKAINQGLKITWLSGSDALSIFPNFYRTAMQDIITNDFYFFS